MPQTFQVLRCYKCEIFQVHPTKKAKKWECKLCGEKQSIKRFYGLGTGKECRLQVQKLNAIRGELDSACCATSAEVTISQSPDHLEPDEIPVCTIAKKSKWLDYVDSTSEEKQETPDEVMPLDNTEVVLELPIKRRKIVNVCNKNMKSQIDTAIEISQEKKPIRLLNDNAQGNVLIMEGNKADIIKPANNLIPKKYVRSPIVNNSKWAQFVEETQNCNDENDVDPIVHAPNSVYPVFPFFEDEFLDSVLDL